MHYAHFMVFVVKALKLSGFPRIQYVVINYTCTVDPLDLFLLTEILSLGAIFPQALTSHLHPPVPHNHLCILYEFNFLEFHIQVRFFCAWLVSLNRASSGFIIVIANDKISFFLKTK